MDMNSTSHDPRVMFHQRHLVLTVCHTELAGSAPADTTWSSTKVLVTGLSKQPLVLASRFTGNQQCVDLKLRTRAGTARVKVRGFRSGPVLLEPGTWGLENRPRNKGRKISPTDFVTGSGIYL